jgi:lysozyme family protein
MVRVVIVGGLEKVMTLTLMLFSFLVFFPNDTTSLLIEALNKSQATTYSQERVVDSDELKSSASQKTAVVTPSSKNANFDQAVVFTLHHEGGLVDDKSDKGGITKYGISYTFLRSLLAHEPHYLSLLSLKNKNVKPAIIKNLTLHQAIQIYNIAWWKKYNFGSINNQALATKAFDYSVNMGSSKAIKLLQKACQNQANASVPVNGQLDNSTVAYINSLNPSQANQLLYSYENVACHYYSNIAKRHPADKKFLAGWLRRANDNHCLSA